MYALKTCTHQTSKAVKDGESWVRNMRKEVSPTETVCCNAEIAALSESNFGSLYSPIYIIYIQLYNIHNHSKALWRLASSFSLLHSRRESQHTYVRNRFPRLDLQCLYQCL